MPSPGLDPAQTFQIGLGFLASKVLLSAVELGLLMSLNMLIETPAGFEYTGAEFRSWCREAGFRSCELLPLTGPTSAAIAHN